MFTGLVEEIGVVKSIRNIGGGRKITVQATKVMDDLKIDDSIALNGTCQTVVARTSGTFDVEAVEETLKKTTLDSFIPGHSINLERAARLSDRMGGHLVQGHVDCTGRVTSIDKLSTAVLVWVEFPDRFTPYIVPVGSICIDGVSLTAAKVELNRFMVSVIPHTWSVTTFSQLSPGSRVNLEFDIIGKYVEKMLMPHKSSGKRTGGSPYLEQFIDQPDF